VSNYLFAYGTLLPERAPSDVAHIVARLRAIGEGTLRGTLYDFGDYPGAVLDDSSQTLIHGTIFELPQDRELLRELDEYEGFDPADASGSLFVRQVQPVTLATGELLRCWVYVYNRPAGTAPTIADGRYRRE